MKPEAFQTFKSRIHRLLAEDRPKEAIDALFAALEEFSDKEWEKTAIQAAARLKEVVRQFVILGVIGHKTYMDNKADVTAKVLEVLDKMEEAVHQPSEENLGNLLKALAALVTMLSAFPGKKEPSKYSSFTDPRDGRTYKTVRLVGLTWMAENLDYDVGEGCWWYDNDPENGKKYGRLYTWEAAKRACPPGWRLPTDEEWRVLARSFGGYVDTELLKTDWIIGDEFKGYSSLVNGGNSGLSILLGGGRWPDGEFSSLEQNGLYWSATKFTQEGDIWHFWFSYSKKLYRFTRDKMNGFSCRCIRNVNDLSV